MNDWLRHRPDCFVIGATPANEATAFFLNRPISGISIRIVVAAPALEILDTRVRRSDPATGKARVIHDTVSDNAANAGIVLGAERHRLDDTDLRWTGVILKRDGVIEETGLGAGVLDDPVTGILWLVHRLAQYGQGLKAGDIVLSGSFIRPVEAPPGSQFDADFGPFGRVAVSFG